MFTSLRRLGWVSLCVLTLAACNIDDGASENQPTAAGEACSSDAACASGLCLADTEVCAETCDASCDDASLVCTEGFCLAQDYCDEGFGPGCAPTTCEPGCASEATCDLEAADGPTCICDDGFEGDGLTCTPVEQNPCLENNGGCGDPSLVQCDAVLDDAEELIAECTTLNPCLEDNGGCGDVEFFTCTNTEVGVGECSDVDFCAADNGGCGDPARYECIPVSGELPLCKFVAACDVEYAAPLLEDTFVNENEPSAIFGDRPFLVVNPESRTRSYDQVVDYTASRTHHTYLKFDLSGIPETGPVVGANLQMVGFDGFAWLGDGNTYTYTYLADDGWSSDTLTWNTILRDSAERLGFWNLWYGTTPEERVVANQSTALTEAIGNHREAGEEQVAFKLSSSGYTNLYYSSEHDEADKHPQLTVTLRECNQAELTPDANATVNNRQTDTALGEGEGLLADRDRAEFYVRFDMSAIPLGAEIVGAQLDLVATDAVDYGGDATFTLDYLTTEIWDEASVTYTTRPTAAGETLATFTLDTSADRDPAERVTLDTVDLFETVVERFESEGSISLRVTANDDAATFAGRTNSEAGWRPRLTVIYE